ncbi:carboxypeptidase regulatory-like domain-containing protein [Tenacibaculum tangerinum]|uniref:Carboxypeptidase regulatory-like domain-containing protein n=1 Tax=Tenacibaculum tangerinum TaxID=3038772 RepID=A0ABY8L2J4_9FLAO|nr:carboxypeptidase regulatory-like domain-containing protein [Tenacibaculum tangerinum]WGH75484.1 carboxypeptidase regulatory-like domain-containing protein [Tenacibaculum tangerinum]
MNNQTTIIYVFFLCIGLSSSALGQSDAIEKANTEYDNLNYINAIEIYESVVESGVEDPKLIHRLASANYFNGKYDDAAKWYKKYYSIPTVKRTILDDYRYGQVLKTQKQYKEADSLLATYYQYKGMRYKSLEGVNEYTEIIDNSGIFRFQQFEWNTVLSEYPAFIKENDLYVSGYDLDSKKKRRIRDTTTDLYKLEESGKFVPISDFVNSVYNEGSFTITNDGKTMYFTRNSYLNGRLKKRSDDVVTIGVYVAQFRDGEWKNVKEFPFNNENYSVGHPTLSKDNKTLYYISDEPGGKGGTDLYKVTVFKDGTFGEPENMVELNTLGDEMFPFIDHIDGSLYFSSDGPQSMGGLDVFISKLTADKVYKRAYNLGNQINSTYDDFAFLIGKNRIGYFASNKVNDVGMDDVYSFEMLKDFQVPNFFKLNGIVTDYDTDLPLHQVQITLFDKENNIVSKTVTNAFGGYEFDEIKASEMGYITADKEAYQHTEKNITPKHIEAKILDVTMLSLAKEIPKFITISGKVKDVKLKAPISRATVKLLDINNNVLQETTSNDAGSYVFSNVTTNAVVFMRAEKSSYQTEEEEINLKEVHNGEFIKDIYLAKNNVLLEMGNDISTILNPIYFDYGQSNIRPDAAVELEKIVQVLRKYPTLVIKIESHTDSRGTSDFNRNLSDKRAKATRDYIIYKGISDNRITSATGYGEDKLLNHCGNANQNKCTEEEHQVNRRSNFYIVDVKKEESTTKYQETNNLNTSETVKFSDEETKTVATGLVYRIQVGVLNSPNRKDLFPNLKNLEVLYIESYYKYFCCASTTLKQAKAERRKVNKLGYKDAFIVPFFDGKKITLKEAILLSK